MSTSQDLEPSAERTTSSFSRPQLLLRLIGLASLLLISATWPLWTPQQVFPQVPLLAWVVGAGPLFDWLALACIVAGSLTMIVQPHGRLSLVACALLWLGYGGAILLDQHRLQPWAYQFLLLALALTTLAEQRALQLCRWLTVSIYAYSAWSKLDYSFLKVGGTGEYFVNALLQAVSLPVDSPAILALGSWTIVLGEFAVAIVLLVAASRRLGVVLAIGLHATLLLILGPWGLNHTAGVLGWNLFFMMLVPLLFWPPRVVPGREPSSRSVPVLLARGVLAIALGWPLLEPLGYCDSWLAWSLYSSRNEVAVVLLNESAVEKLPLEWKPYVRQTSDPNQHRLRIDLWSLEVLRVPVYPENRFRLGVVREVRQRADIDGELRLELYGSADRWSGEREVTRLNGREEIQQHAKNYWFSSTPR